MRSTLDLHFEVAGQSIYVDAPEGRPSSVTSLKVHAWDADDEDIESAIDLLTLAVEPSPNTTLDGAAGVGQADRRLLPVAATTGFVIGRQYLLTSADGMREWFEVLEVDSGVSVTARHPLHNAYASADTVQSTRIAATVDSTWIADEDNLSGDSPNPGYRVRCVYVVAGATCVRDVYLDLVRYPGTHSVTPIDVDNLTPGWIHRLPTDHRRDQGQRLVADAYRAVKLDLHGIWRADQMVANAEVIDELVRYKSVELAEWARLMAGGTASGLGERERYDVAVERYTSRFKALVARDKTPTRSAGGAAMQKFPPPVMRR